MKTKLLKKIKKRYNWYFNKENYPVLIDHYTKLVTVYSVEYCAKRNNYTLEQIDELIECGKEEWCLRIMKRDLLERYGWTLNKSVYRLACKNLKNKQIKTK